MYDRTNDRLYKKLNGQQYQECQRRAPKVFIEPSPEAPIKESQGYPTWVVQSALGIRPMYAFQETPVSRPLPNTFDDYVQTLHEWEKRLIQHSYVTLCPHVLIHRLNAGPIMCASDGSVRKPYATFGFVIRDNNQDNLIRGRGPASGSDPNSLRSEAYGNLAVCRYLYRLSQFTNIPLTSPIHMFVDNKALISRITHARTCKYENPSACIKSEWDVINEIAVSIEKLSTEVHYKWIKSHQDDVSAYNDLSPEAQLNCDADALAGDHYQDMLQPENREPPLPSNPIQLLIDDNSITSKYKSKIRVASTFPALKEYLCHRFDWDPVSVDDIDWTLFVQITKSFPKQHTIIVKHIHAIAPTGHIAHRHRDTLTAQCPACPCPHEDNNHVMLCPATTRANWRSETISAIIQCSSDHSDPILKSLLQRGLEAFHERRPGVDDRQYPARYTTLIRQQNALGWDQLYRGRWSIQWSRLHHLYAREQMHWTPKHRDGDRWVVAHGRKLLEQWLRLWATRNMERHGADAVAQQQARKAILTTELERIYALRTQVTPLDRQVFYPSITHHLNARPDMNVLENWILTHRSALTASAAQARRQGIHQNRAIHDFFPILNRPTNSAPPAELEEPQ